MTIWLPELDRSKPLYVAIADAMASDVANGVLARGDRLPPQRELAWKLGVTHGTVTRAYREAELRGLLAGEVGRGSYIRNVEVPQPLAPNAGNVAELVDLSHVTPPTIISGDEFDLALESIMRNPNKLSLLDYTPLEGLPQHREMAKHWLKRSGIEVGIQNVFVTGGAQVALLTILQALAQPGEKVMAETINYALLRSTFETAHVEPLCLGMDSDGLLPEEFERAAKAGLSRLLYLVPSIQNPTTHSMGRERRDAIVAIARKYDVTIIEDDIFRLLNPRAQPATFYTLAPERVVHVTSLSKSIAPGLRIGFVVTPQGQENILHRHLRSLSPRSVGMMGELARYWINSGKADEFLSRAQHVLAQRRAAFLEVFKGFHVNCEMSAPFAWLQLPDEISAKRLTLMLRQRHIAITPGTAFDLSAKNLAANHVRICFGYSSQNWQAAKTFQEIRTVIEDGETEDFMPVA
jgi:DNA-binding transcriptional MocR family regulator